jgi:hypothetical protein
VALGMRAIARFNGVSMTDRERIIAVARRRAEGVGEIPSVLDVARTTDDRYLLAICLDCFRAVLPDTRAPVGHEVGAFLGELLRDPGYKRIRKRTLITVIWLDWACIPLLETLLEVYRRPNQPCIVSPARWAVVCVGWEALDSVEPADRALGVRVFGRMGVTGLLNLRSFLEHREPDPETRADVEAAIARLSQRYPEW